MPDTGEPQSSCLIELDDHRLWALIATNLRAAAAAQGFPPCSTGYPANTCTNELPDHINMAIVACAFAQIASGVIPPPIGGFATGMLQFGAGDDFAQSGSSDYLQMFLPNGDSHVFWFHAGTSTQPALG